MKPGRQNSYMVILNSIKTNEMKNFIQKFAGLMIIIILAIAVMTIVFYIIDIIF